MAATRHSVCWELETTGKEPIGAGATERLFVEKADETKIEHAVAKFTHAMLTQ